MAQGVDAGGPTVERREDTWPEGVPRQRRRPRWTEFRDAYPRIVTGMALGIAGLLAADAFLLVQGYRYRRQLETLRASMGAKDRARSDALLAVAEGKADLEAALARQQAIADEGLNLAVSLQEGVMHLQREGARLRTMNVQIGADGAPAEGQGRPAIVAPLGRRKIVRLLGADDPWTLPAWLRPRHPEAGASVPGGLGPVAILLDDGNAIYSLPSKGPLADEAYVLPGSVRAQREDLVAIRENLGPGVPVYFH